LNNFENVEDELDLNDEGELDLKNFEKFKMFNWDSQEKFKKLIESKKEEE